LGRFSLNVIGVKCFDEKGSGFFKFSPITFIIGKNNSGKSTILDVLQECCKDSGLMFQGPLSRSGITSSIEIKRQPEEENLIRAFPPTASRRTMTEANYWEFARKHLLPYHLTWTFDESRNPIFQSKELIPDATIPDLTELLNRSIDFPFSGRWITRILAERDVRPEQRDTERKLESSGRGLTNLIRAFINSEDLPRTLVEIDLLNDLNQIYLGDSEFSAITCQENESTGEWEIYLREDGKGDIRLSQSGSSLKTVFLVLAFLRLQPKIAQTGDSSSLIFCLEEPENNLHPALLRRLISFLALQREERGFSLVITTHSPICIDLATKRDDATILHVKKEENRTVCRNVLDYAGQSSMLEDLDVRGSDILQANGIIWVEGPSDRIYINRWIDIFSNGSLREGVHYTIMLYGGKVLLHFEALPPEELPKKIAMLALNRNIAVVIDSDRRPYFSKMANGKTRKPRMQLNQTKREIIKQVEAIGGYAWVTKGKEIENYVPRDIWVNLAGSGITIKDEYTDVPSILISKNLASSKVDLAHKIEKFIARDSMKSNLDLEECLSTLCDLVRKWNGLN
jgi:energy-coupling factor transporter ATP-binding protein EcfA2